MNLSQVNQTLQDIFSRELSDGKKRHVVFWYDAEQEFKDDLQEIQVHGVEMIHLTDHNAFFVKHQIEKVNTENHLIIYSDQPKPPPRENWLIDILKYSIEFSTDKTSVIMRELGITDQSLRHVFKQYSKFFNNKDRYQKFLSYEVENWTEAMIHLVVLATLCKTEVASFDLIVKKLLIEELNEGNTYWDGIVKFGDEEVFWSLTEKNFGYQIEQPSLKSLFVSMCLTHLHETLKADFPKSWLPFVSKSKTNNLVFINQFMHHTNDSVYYDEWANRLERELNVSEYLHNWDRDDYIECDTFRIFDEYFIKDISGHVSEFVQDVQYFHQVIAIRRKLHWFSQYKFEYLALSAAMALLEQFKQCRSMLVEKAAFDFFALYRKELYKLDQYYREFHFHFDQAKNQDVLDDVRQVVENTYVNGYLEELSVHWSNSVQTELTSHWPILGVKQQHQFYQDFIEPHIANDERVFVIISDAFRYEAATELYERLNSARKASTELEAIQGVVPSYTALGMASLLPNRSIKFEGDQVKVDERNTAGSDYRQKILQQKVADAMVMSYAELSSKKRQLREIMKGKKLIYIYHNVIDARGDHGATEHEVFFAVNDAINELLDAINELVNKVSATNIYVTADHGFTYKRSCVQAADKIERTQLETDIDKRRFVVTDKANDRTDLLAISLDYLGANEGLHALVPRGTMSYSRKGVGANFMHGGAMLQEIVVPVIKFKNDRSRSEQNAIKKVTIQLTNISRKITSMITYLQFFQTEKVESKRLPLRLKAYLADEEGTRISNENIIIADSKSEDPHNRTYKEKFVLKNMKYDKTKNYYLILEDEEKDLESVYEKYPFIIDLAIADDFGF